MTILIKKLKQAAAQTGIKDVAIAGGVSANSGLRKALTETGHQEGWNVFIPRMEYCTDNAAMIAVAASFKFQRQDFAAQSVAPSARMT